MNKTLLRVVAFLLVPCLLADTVTASGFQMGMPAPFNLSQTHRLDEEAMANAAVPFFTLDAFAGIKPKIFAFHVGSYAANLINQIHLPPSPDPFWHKLVGTLILVTTGVMVSTWVVIKSHISPKSVLVVEPQQAKDSTPKAQAHIKYVESSQNTLANPDYQLRPIVRARPTARIIENPAPKTLEVGNNSSDKQLFDTKNKPDYITVLLKIVLHREKPDLHALDNFRVTVNSGLGFALNNRLGAEQVRKTRTIDDFLEAGLQEYPARINNPLRVNKIASFIVTAANGRAWDVYELPQGLILVKGKDVRPQAILFASDGEAKLQSINTFLDHLVENGALTRAHADSISSVFANEVPLVSPSQPVVLATIPMKHEPAHMVPAVSTLARPEKPQLESKPEKPIELVQEPYTQTHDEPVVIWKPRSGPVVAPTNPKALEYAQSVESQLLDRMKEALELGIKNRSLESKHLAYFYSDLEEFIRVIQPHLQLDGVHAPETNTRPLTPRENNILKVSLALKNIGGNPDRMNIQTVHALTGLSERTIGSVWSDAVLYESPKWMLYKKSFEKQMILRAFLRMDSAKSLMAKFAPTPEPVVAQPQPNAAEPAANAVAAPVSSELALAEAHQVREAPIAHKQQSDIAPISTIADEPDIHLPAEPLHDWLAAHFPHGWSTHVATPVINEIETKVLLLLEKALSTPAPATPTHEVSISAPGTKKVSVAEPPSGFIPSVFQEVHQLLLAEKASESAQEVSAPAPAPAINWEPQPMPVPYQGGPILLSPSSFEKKPSASKLNLRAVDFVMAHQHELNKRFRKALLGETPVTEEQLNWIQTNPDKWLALIAKRMGAEDFGYREIDHQVLAIRKAVKGAPAGMGSARFAQKITGLPLSTVKSRWDYAFAKKNYRGKPYKLQTYAAHLVTFGAFIQQYLNTDGAAAIIKERLHTPGSMPQAPPEEVSPTEILPSQPLGAEETAPPIAPLPAIGATPENVSASLLSNNYLRLAKIAGFVVAIIATAVAVIHFNVLGTDHLVSSLVDWAFNIAYPVLPAHAPVVAPPDFAYMHTPVIQVVQEAAQTAIKHTLAITPHDYRGLGNVVLRLRQSEPALREVLGGSHNIWQPLGPNKPNPVKLLAEVLKGQHGFSGLLSGVHSKLPTGQYDVSTLYKAGATVVQQPLTAAAPGVSAPVPTGISEIFRQPFGGGYSVPAVFLLRTSVAVAYENIASHPFILATKPWLAILFAPIFYGLWYVLAPKKPQPTAFQLSREGKIRPDWVQIVQRWLEKYWNPFKHMSPPEVPKGSVRQGLERLPNPIGPPATRSNEPSNGSKPAKISSVLQFKLQEAQISGALYQALNAVSKASDKLKGDKILPYPSELNLSPRWKGIELKLEQLSGEGERPSFAEVVKLINDNLPGFSKQRIAVYIQTFLSQSPLWKEEGWQLYRIPGDIFYVTSKNPGASQIIDMSPQQELAIIPVSVEEYPSNSTVLAILLTGTPPNLPLSSDVSPKILDGAVVATVAESKRPVTLAYMSLKPTPSDRRDRNQPPGPTLLSSSVDRLTHQGVFDFTGKPEESLTGARDEQQRRRQARGPLSMAFIRRLMKSDIHVAVEGLDGNHYSGLIRGSTRNMENVTIGDIPLRLDDIMVITPVVTPGHQADLLERQFELSTLCQQISDATGLSKQIISEQLKIHLVPVEKRKGVLKMIPLINGISTKLGPFLAGKETVGPIHVYRTLRAAELLFIGPDNQMTSSILLERVKQTSTWRFESLKRASGDRSEEQVSVLPAVRSKPWEPIKFSDKFDEKDGFKLDSVASVAGEFRKMLDTKLKNVRHSKREASRLDVHLAENPLGPPTLPPNFNVVRTRVRMKPESESISPIERVLRYMPGNGVKTILDHPLARRIFEDFLGGKIIDDDLSKPENDLGDSGWTLKDLRIAYVFLTEGLRNGNTLHAMSDVARNKVKHLEEGYLNLLRAALWGEPGINVILDSTERNSKLRRIEAAA